MPLRAVFRSLLLLFLGVGALAGQSAPLGAEQLPFRHYGSAEGVAETQVTEIFHDRKGHLWFAGNDGLSRFDGYRFHRYGTRDGLGSPLVWSITEDPAGDLWVGTNGGGVARLVEEPPTSSEEGAPGPRRIFEAHRVGPSNRSNRVHDLVFDLEGRPWCLTEAGLYRGDPLSLRFEVVLEYRSDTFAPPLLVDRRGRVWAGVPGGIALVEPDDRVTRWDLRTTQRGEVNALLEFGRGRILAARRFGLFEYVAPAPGVDRGRWVELPLRLAPSQELHSLWAAPDGTLWIGTSHGLLEYRDGRQSNYDVSHGLRNDFVWEVTGDREGNLWLGTYAGLTKLAAYHPLSWKREDGLPDPAVNLVIPSREGRVYVRMHRRGLAEVVGRKVTPIPRSQDPPFREEVNRRCQVLQDREGDWWVATRTALYRFRGPSLQLERGRRFDAADGIPQGTLFGGWTSGIHEDAMGRLWVASRRGLYRHDPDRTEPPFFDLLPLAGFAAEDEPRDIVSDASGTVWFRTDTETVRVVDDRLERLRPTEGLPTTQATFLFVDSRGWLWVGTGSIGLSMTRDPRARAPRWTHYSTADGLSSDFVLTAAEDPLGAMYFGTPRGLDRLEPDTGRIRHFTVRDGLAGGHISHLRLDRQGRLWVATKTGLTCLDPRSLTTETPPPPVRLTDVRVGGERIRLPERGVREASPLTLSATRNNVQIEFLGLSFRHEGSLRYQYRLEGIDSDWSPPSEQRSVQYGRLAPGTYRFQVRAVSPNGESGDEPASLAFTITPPWWRRWWFVALGVALLSLAVESVHRLRLRGRLELEAIRTRIATDLHDDIGSNLSRIAILSEVARRDLDGHAPAAREHLSRIASVSRELLDAMADIVWAVNPARDSLRELGLRMRRFSDDLLSARDIALRFHVPSDGGTVVLGADTRRELFLIFKEAVNNVARHSCCRSAEIELTVDNGCLALRVRDDGRGFDPEVAAGAAAGNGVASMRRRASRLGGTLEVDGGHGQGTTVRLRIPLAQRGSAGRVLGRVVASRGSRVVLRSRGNTIPRSDVPR